MIIMRCHALVFITLFAFIAAEEEWKPISDVETLAKNDKDCAKESALTLEQRRKIKEQDYADEKEVHAYVHCIIKKPGIFTEEKGFIVDRFIAQLDVFLYAEKARDMVTNCADSNEQNSTAEVWCFRIYKCLRNLKLNDILTPRNSTT